MSHRSHRSRSRRALLSALPLSALILAGCSGDNSGPAADEYREPVVGGTLTYATGDAEPDCLDPHNGGNYPQSLVSSQFLETLFTRDENDEIIPWLAESAELSDDGLTYTITVREGIQFSDGTPLTSEAIKANVEHLQDPETKSSTGYLGVEQVESVDVVDDRTAELHMSRPDNSLLESLAMQWTAIHSPESLDRTENEICEQPIGTGPFVVESWDRQQQIILQRNDDYVLPNRDEGRDARAEDNDGQAYLDEIIWRFIPEASTRYAALESGEVDVIDNPQPDNVRQAIDTGTFGHLDAPRPGSSNRLELNSAKAPFDDPAVREAFIKSLDINSSIDGLFFDTVDRSYSLLSSVEPLGISAEELFSPDVDRANQLLDEAGWDTKDDDGIRTKDGERLELTFPVSTNQSVPAEQSLFEQIQATAAEVGFDVQIELLDLSSWYAALGEHNYNLVSAPYTKVGPSVLRILYHSEGTIPAPSGYFANNAQVTDDEIDQLLMDAEQTTDEQERADLYEQAQRRILEDYYVLPLYNQQNQFLYRADVGGMGDTNAVANPLYYSVFVDAQ
ncbi:ABC transporter substrate-binding protein [Auritidibacter ignavus]|uniref:ABC transporter substrate-binding protein n=1 Tax=Auritidibacter ignavus TaxID=678932 RepID=UPI000F02F6C6|nr:ABC transporter substrate-binding protein [Auritidibacter ignavus]NIH70659.1 peptide/nickel transport system substrate-binding protein [Auritidibacter ignavus]RMX23213.1 ABC transporter substrate-binding protein [Auritidibacter ignavus]